MHDSTVIIINYTTIAQAISSFTSTITLLCAFFICDDQSLTSGQKFNTFFICCSYVRYAQLNSLMHDVKRMLKEFAKNVFFMYSSLHRQLRFLSFYVLQAVLVRVLLFLQQTALLLHPQSIISTLSHHNFTTTSLHHCTTVVVPLYSFNGKRLFILKLR